MDLNKCGITQTLINEILIAVKLLLNIPNVDENATQDEINESEIKDTILKYLITEICVKTLIRTRRETFPEALKYVIPDITKDVYQSDVSESDIQSIQSMSEAGRSVSYGVSAVIQAKVTASIKKQLDERENLINEYKLLYKTHDNY